MTQWGLDTLFNPAKRHMDEEKQRLQSTREEVGDNSGGKRIDFESGKVSIKRATTDADPAADAIPQADADGAADADRDADADTESSNAGPSSNAEPSSKVKTAADAGPRPAPSAAAVRAAARRGRTAR